MLKQETEYTNAFIDVRCKRTSGASVKYNGATRATQTLGATHLKTEIRISNAVFTPDGTINELGVNVYVKGTETRVNKGTLKIYVTNALFDKEVLCIERIINDDDELKYTKDTLHFDRVLAKLKEMDTELEYHPYRNYTVHADYTGSDVFDSAESTFNNVITYQTDAVINVKVKYGDTEILLDNTENNSFASDNLEITGVNNISVELTATDINNNPITRLDLGVRLQDYQKVHGNYDTGADIIMGTYNPTTAQTDSTGTAIWTANLDNNFWDTGEYCPNRSIKLFAIVPKVSNLLNGGDSNIRSNSGFEAHVKLNYKHILQCTEFNNGLNVEPATFATDYDTKLFNFSFVIKDEFLNPVGCTGVLKVEGITMRENNQTVWRDWKTGCVPDAERLGNPISIDYSYDGEHDIIFYYTGLSSGVKQFQAVFTPLETDNIDSLRYNFNLNIPPTKTIFKPVDNSVISITDNNFTVKYKLYAENEYSATDETAYNPVVVMPDFTVKLQPMYSSTDLTIADITSTGYEIDEALSAERATDNDPIVIYPKLDTGSAAADMYKEGSAEVEITNRNEDIMKVTGVKTNVPHYERDITFEFETTGELSGEYVLTISSAENNKYYGDGQSVTLSFN